MENTMTAIPEKVWFTEGKKTVEVSMKGATIEKEINDVFFYYHGYGNCYTMQIALDGITFFYELRPDTETKTTGIIKGMRGKGGKKEYVIVKIT